MYLDVTFDNDFERMRIREQERTAAQNWRFRHLKSRGHKALTVVLTTVLAFFLR